MKSVLLNVPTLGFIVTTRAALGFGLGLLLSARLPAERRRAIGAALVAAGAITTIPAAMAVLRGSRRSRPATLAAVGRDRQLIGAVRFPRKGDDL